MNCGEGLFLGGEGRDVGAAAGEECGERERETGDVGSYHRPVFGGREILLIDSAAGGLCYEGVRCVLLVW